MHICRLLFMTPLPPVFTVASCLFLNIRALQSWNPPKNFIVSEIYVLVNNKLTLARYNVAGYVAIAIAT